MKNNLTQSAYNYLSRREHSAIELKHKLCDKGYDSNEVDDIIVKLQLKDLQSDERYADCIYRNRENKGFGWLFIVNELKQKDISDEIIHNLAKNSEIDWYLKAQLAYNKRFGVLPIANNKDKAKRMRFMQYRGFSTEQILVAISSSNKNSSANKSE